MRHYNITYVNSGPAISLVVRPAIKLVGPAEEDALSFHRFVGLGRVEVVIVIAMEELVIVGVIRHVPVRPHVVHAS
jgi:hypothetical protein